MHRDKVIHPPGKSTLQYVSSENDVNHLGVKLQFVVRCKDIMDPFRDEKIDSLE